MKIKNIILTLAISFLFLEIGYAQTPTPAAPQTEAILLKGAVAHLGNGRVINNSLIGFDKGKLTIVADATTAKIDQSGYKIIDVAGQHVYPGFILPNSQVGLVEVSSVNAMSDNSETGDLNPNVRALISYNTDSEFAPTFRFNGILMAESTPSGGRISGTSSVMNMDGWNWQDAVHTADVGIHVNWPGKMNREFDFATFTRKTVPNKEYDNQVMELSDLFEAAAVYKQQNAEMNLKLESLQGLYDGSKTLFLHTSGPKAIVESVNFAKNNGIKNITIVAGTDALMVKAFLKDNGIAVVIPPVHSLPARADMDIDLPYRLPGLLTEAGIMVSLSHTGMLSNARNLAFYAGTAVAYGMEKEEALKTITSNPASILGISDKVGTLEEGKDATLFVSKGDALDIRTNMLSLAYIQGKTIILDGKQQELFDRYSKKYGHGE